MSLLDAALNLANYVPEPFVAPIPTTGKVEVFAFQNGVPLRYSLYGQKIGWWIIEPRKDRAAMGDAAQISEIVEYLENLPRFYVIACIPSGEQEWLVVPFNGSDAAQRGWKDGQPKKMYLCNERVEPFDLIVGRKLGDILLYDSPDFRLTTIALDETQKPKSRDWSNAYNIISEWVKKAEEEAKKLEIKTQLDKVQDKLKFLLEFMGASLVSSEKKGNGYQVVWKAPDGHSYKMGVKEDGRISVAGFCLAGTDSEHNLSSIVQVMSEAQQRKRPDIQRAYADYQEENIEEDDDDY